MSDVTRLLDAVDRGEPQAAEELLPLVYEELRRLAADKMAAQPAGQTLQATALVHEAYLKLVGDDAPRWKNSRHFFCAASEAMRQILIDRARRKRRPKHGGDLERIDLEGLDVAANAESETLLVINEALEHLAEEDNVKAEVVKLRFFVGLSVPETGRVLGLSEPTVKRHWAFARAWLLGEIRVLQAGS